MKQILHFYKVYKRLSKLSFLFGAVAVCSGLVFLAFQRDSSLLGGTAYPLILLGIIQMGGSFRDYFSADGRVRFMRRIQDPNPRDFHSSERNYVKDVLQGARKSRKAKLFLLIFGLVITLTSLFAEWTHFSLGSGIGISLQSACMLVFNVIKEYQLGVFNQTVTKS